MLEDIPAIRELERTLFELERLPAPQTPWRSKKLEDPALSQLQKRMNALIAITKTDEFLTVIRAHINGCTDEKPVPPDILYLADSKRHWEARVAQWRRDLRQFQEKHPQFADGGYNETNMWSYTRSTWPSFSA